MSRAARLGAIWASGGREPVLTYYGTASPLSTARYWLAATTVGNYALFGGGKTLNTSAAITAVTDAYAHTLTKIVVDPLSQARCSLAAATVGDYALFGGGDAGKQWFSPEYCRHLY